MGERVRGLAGKTKRTVIVLGAAMLTVAALTSAALAKSNPSGAVFTTTDPAIDGAVPEKCKNGSPLINCNHYSAKPWVWLNGGPASNGLSPNGKYFFAVVEPGGQSDPNDGSAENLSDNYDTYQNRTFTVTNGEVSAYAGTHTYDAPNDKLRLFPYADTSNNGGVYKMAVCYIGPTGASYPVDPKSCKYDSFKVDVDTSPPVCILTATGVNLSGQKYIQVTVQDAGSGLQTIVVNTVLNATLAYAPALVVGTTSPVVITATKIVQTSSSFLKLTVTNVAGLSTTCDPEVPGVKLRLARRGGR